MTKILSKLKSFFTEYVFSKEVSEVILFRDMSHREKEQYYKKREATLYMKLLAEERHSLERDGFEEHEIEETMSLKKNIIRQKAKVLAYDFDDSLL